MKLLVIGSKGFIGSHAYQFFKDMGIVVYGCDVAVDYVDTNYFQVDATNSNFEEIFSSEKFDACINCSGAASVPDSLAHPYRDFHLNVINVYTILEALRKHNSTCKFINLSSAAVYGNPTCIPVKEMHAVGPLSPYGWHKLYAEQVCSEFYNHFGIASCSLRIFSAFGPGLRKQIFWDWFQNAKRHKKLAIYGTGNESRDFIYIDDLLHAIHCVILHAKCQAEVVNVAAGREIKISYAASVFQSLHHDSIEYSFNQQVREGDPLNWLADISILQTMGYNPKISFEQGLNKYMQWVEKE